MAKAKKMSTVIDRILLHLLNFRSYEGEMDGSMELTQIGIADAVGITRGNAARAIQPLIDRGFVECHKVHVPGIRLKRSIYYLTCQGHERAGKLRERFGSTSIEVVDRDGIRSETETAALLENTQLEIKLVDILREANETWVFDTQAYVRKQNKSVLSAALHLSDIPKPGRFFGRQAELETAKQWIGRPESGSMVISGMPGIGKTCFISQLLNGCAESVPIHLFAIKQWCSLRALLTSLAGFFEDRGRRELRTYLGENKVIDFSEAEYLIAGFLREAGKVILAYDDYHNSSVELQTFFKLLHGTVKESGSKLIVVGRSVNPFYDRKDATANGPVFELALEGLDRDSALELAREAGVSENNIPDVFEKTRGHPMFIELLASGSLPKANMDLERFITDEFITAMARDELEALRYISVHRYAVERNALEAHQKALSRLLRESIVRPSKDGHVELHDMIKSAMYRSLSREELEKYHSDAAEHYLESYSADRLMEAVYHLMMASRNTDACRVILDKEEKLLRSDKMEELARTLNTLLNRKTAIDDSEKVRLLFMLGQALSFIGEWDEAIMCFNRAMVLAPSDQKLKMRCKSGIAQISLRRNNLSETKSLFEEIIDWAEKNDEMEMKVDSSYYLGSVYELLGDNELALDYFMNTLKISFMTNNRHQMAKAYYGQGRIFHRRHEYRKALESKNKALDIAMKIDNKHIASKILTSIGNTLDRMELLDEEIDAHEQAITLARDSGAIRTLAYALSNAGAAYIDVDELDKSMKYLEEASEIFERLGEHHMFATTEMNKAINLLLKGDYDKAIFLFNECEIILKEIESNSLLMDSYFRFGQTCKKAGCLDDAISYFNKALAISKKIGDKEASRQINHEIRSLVS